MDGKDFIKWLDLLSLKGNLNSIAKLETLQNEIINTNNGT